MPRYFVFSIMTGVILLIGSFAQAQQNLGNPLDGLAKLKNYSTQRSSSSDPNWKNGNADARPIPPGGTLVIADLKGPGEIEHIWNTVAARERGYSRLLVLRMYWDDETNPSVESPLGDFYGIGHGMDVPFTSLPVSVASDGRGRNCYWPMPFRKSAKITVTNEGRQPVDAFYYYVDWHQLRKLDKDTGYFHAQYRQEFPAVMGRNYLIADIVGRGQYVGTVLNWRQVYPSWPGEGDDFFFIDGETEPSLRGTGTEDYFCDGWGFRKQTSPYFGAPLVEGSDVGNRTSVYRWHIPDPVAFKKSLRMEIEHKGVTFNEDGSVKSGFEERPDDISSVAFWYQTEPHKPFPPMPAGYARLYYDYANMKTGETFIPVATATAGEINAQDMDGGKRLWWHPADENETLTIPFEASDAGKYDLIFVLAHSWDYGNYQLELNGKPLGGVLDLYNPTVLIQEHVFGQQILLAGKNIITVRGRGKDPMSKGYLFGFDGLIVSKK